MTLLISDLVGNLLSLRRRNRGGFLNHWTWTMDSAPALESYCITEVFYKSPWLEQAVWISVCSLICHAWRPDPHQRCLRPQQVTIQDGWKHSSTYFLSTQLSFLINQWAVLLSGSCCHACLAHVIDSQSFKQLLILLFSTVETLRPWSYLHRY